MNLKVAAIVVVVGGAVAGLSIPLSNMIEGGPAPLKVAPDLMARDAEFVRPASIITRSCANCHRAEPSIPWYFKLPKAREMIAADMEMGRQAWDATAVLSDDWAAMDEVAMAKVESVMWLNSMPPARYTAIHWEGSLSDAEKREISRWIALRRKAIRNDQRVAAAFAGDPIAPIPAERAGLNRDKAALGSALYHDVRLSGDNTVSCASCHDLAKGGTDQERYSTGINKQVGGINAPTVYNAVYNVKQFWNGRAVDLKAQAGGPVENPIEMGANFDQVVEKLRGVPEYVQAFQKLYPEGISKDSITDAIAEFESALITPDSRFDKYLMGEKTLSPEEVAGYEAFKTRGCSSCHVGVAMGGTHFEKMGRYKDYFADRGNPTDADDGLFAVTKVESDRHRFKVPTLRNVALTFPYLHDGTVTDLRNAVRVMGMYQLSRPLGEQDVENIFRFLGSLTGKLEGQPLDQMPQKVAPTEGQPN